MTQTIEQLTARIRELEAENAALVKTIQRDTITSMKQLAASQLSEKRLREALKKIGRYSTDHVSTDWADEALSTPADTSALDAYTTQRVKEALFAEATRGIPFNLPRDTTYTLGTVGEIVAITRQRDLAVEALTKTLAALRMPCDRWSKIQSEIVSKAVEAAETALSTIKESEGT